MERQYLTTEKFRNEVKKRYAKRQMASLIGSSNSQKDYTEEEDKFIMAENGMSLLQKATQLKRTYAAIVGRRQRLIAAENMELTKTWRRSYNVERKRPERRQRNSGR